MARIPSLSALVSVLPGIQIPGGAENFRSAGDFPVASWTPPCYTVCKQVVGAIT